MSKFTDEEWNHKEEENILEIYNEFRDDGGDDLDKIVLLSLIPERTFINAMFGIEYDLYMKYDAIEVDKYNDNERKILKEATLMFIENTDNAFQIDVLQTLIFNCQCDVGGLYLIMEQLKKHLIDSGVPEIDIDCI